VSESSQPPAVPEPHELRASNADRERVAKVLHDAMAEGRLTVNELEERLDQVYAAKTFGELEPITRDLPGQQPIRPPQPPAVSNPGRNLIGGQSVSPSTVAIMSGSEFRGPWVVPPHFQATAIMGGVVLDLSEATFEQYESTINVFALMGGVEIRVPDDITVYVTGTGFMGAFEDKARVVGPEGAPVVRVTGFAMMGGVEVKRARGYRDRDRYRDEREVRRQERHEIRDRYRDRRELES
jgi:hypothetical protein